MTIGNTFMTFGQGCQSNQRLNSEITKVDGELYDQEGYRVDVTVWFRHRNENLYYVDSGGNLHGPLDLKHSAKLDGSKKSWESFGRRRDATQSTFSRRSRSAGRHQSDTNLWDAQSDFNYGIQTKQSRRDRRFSETRTHVGADIDVLLDDLDRMGGRRDASRSKYRTSVTRRVGDPVTMIPVMTRWSSLQADRSSGLGKSDAGRFTTTLTRRHVQRHREPVEVLIQKPVSAGVSKVDLISVDTRQGRESMRMNTDERHERERRLVDELLETRKELHELKRTRSMIAEESKHGLIREEYNEVHVPLPRASSHRDIQDVSTSMKNNWSSESNLRQKYAQKQPLNAYSAHRENIRERDGLTKRPEQQRSNRQLASGFGEVIQETISLQPIGRGIHDLESTTAPTTLPRSWTNTAGRANSFAGDEMSQNLRNQNIPSGQSPTPFRQHVRVTSEHRSQAMHPDGVIPRSQGLRGSSAGSLYGATNLADVADSPNSIFKSKENTSHWLMPSISRSEADSLLLNREPGSFIVCQSRSKPSCYALTVRIPQSSGDNEFVRSFLIEQVQVRNSQNPGYHLHGFESEPIYPSLTALVQDHTVNRGALPICLRIPASETEKQWHSQFPSKKLSDFLNLSTQTTSGELISDVLYMGSCDVYPLENAAAVRRAVEQILVDADNPRKGLKKKCEATIIATPGKNLVICDKTGLRFQRKAIAGNRIRFCNFDPENRVFNCPELSQHGTVNSQIFAIIVKKTRFAMTEHMAYVMCQLERNQPCAKVVNFVNANFLGQVR